MTAWEIGKSDSVGVLGVTEVNIDGIQHATPLVFYQARLLQYAFNSWHRKIFARVRHSHFAFFCEMFELMV
jgi:hypothetical protein